MIQQISSHITALWLDISDDETKFLEINILHLAS